MIENSLKEKRKNTLREIRRKRLAGSLRAEKDWVQIHPYGLVVSAEQTRPVMVFKDKEEKHVLPVWVSPIDASVTMSQDGNQQTDANPHRLASKLLESLGVRLKKCFFKEIRGHYQFVELHFEGDSRVKTIEARADEAISFCLSGKADFFATREFMERCRVLDGEMLKAVFSNTKTATGRNRSQYLN